MELEQVCQALFPDRVIIRCSDHDKLKLFNLRIWAAQNHISLYLAVKELLTFWRSRNHYPRRPGTLGVRISTLCGKKSKAYLESRVGELFPGNEHLAIEKDAIIRSFISGSHIPDEDEYSAVDFVNQYRQAIQRFRDQESLTRKRIVKPFRGNPFV